MPRRIMIVDDVATNRILLKARLASAFHDAVPACSGAEALAKARAEPPDLFVIDYLMPGMDGLTLCRTIRADPVLSGIPLIMISGDTDHATKLAALAAGADDFLPKPVCDQILLARIRALLRQRETVLEYESQLDALDGAGLAEGAAAFDGPARIAMVTSDPARAVRWRTDLLQHLADRVEVLSRGQALAGHSAPPDLFILASDPAAPADVLQVMSELRSRPSTRHAVFSVALPAGEGGVAATALDMGADDVFTVPFDAQEVALRARALIARKRKGDRQRARIASGCRMALTDPLTGLANRRHAMPALARIVSAATAEGRPCAVMVIDIDRFKSVNDTHGHAAGDTVLAEVARRLTDGTRPSDLLARIGGEEFLIALPDATEAAARAIAQRLCAAIGDAPVRLAQGAAIPVTISIGLAMSAEATEAPEQLMARADAALLAAKGGGRNKVVILQRKSAA